MTAHLMSVVAEPMPLLAQLSAAPRKLGHRPKESPIGPVVLIFILIVLLVVLAVKIAKRFFTAARQPGPDLALFVELAKAHALSPPEERLLRRLARREKLSNPARVFVEKRHLEAYAKSSSDEAYRHLYQKLFSQQRGRMAAEV